MFTSIDKAIVALIMAVAFMLKTYLDIDLGVSEGAAASIAAFITTVLVWIVPNKD